MDYEKDIRIDEAALDIEWLEQPRLFMQYSRHYEEALRDVDWAKEQLDIKKADIDKKIRKDPERYGVERISEAAIQNAILLHPEYQELSNEYINAKYEAKIAAAAVRAFEQRKSALENLVRLHGQQYFAGPRVPRNITDEREMRQQHLNERIQTRRKQRSKRRNMRRKE